MLVVDLEGDPGVGTALRRVLVDLGVPAAAVPGEPGARAALYRSLLADRRVAVVLDGVRHEAQVRALAPGTGPVVATSRRSLPGLAVDGWVDVPLAGLAAADGAALLLSGDPGGPGWSDACAVRELVEHCGGLPAMLRLLAGVAPGVGGPAAVRAALAAGTPAHVIAMAALPPTPRRVLRAVLDAGVVDVTAALVGALGEPDPRTPLRDLAIRGLLRDRGNGRYRLLPALRTNTAATPPPRRVDHPPPAGPTVGDDDEQAYAVTAAALRRAGDATGEAAVLLRLSAHLVDGGRPLPALDHATRALALASGAGDNHGRGAALTRIAVALTGAGEPAVAVDLFERALAVLADVLDPGDPEPGWCRLGHGEALAALGREPEARAAFGRAGEVFDGAGHAAGAVRAGLRTAESHLRQGATHAALAACRQVLARDPASTALRRVLDGGLRTQVGDGAGLAALTTGAGPGHDAVAEVVRDVLGGGSGEQLLALLAVRDR